MVPKVVQLNSNHSVYYQKPCSFEIVNFCLCLSPQYFCLKMNLESDLLFGGQSKKLDAFFSNSKSFTF